MLLRWAFSRNELGRITRECSTLNILLVWNMNETAIHTKHEISAKRKGKTIPQMVATKSYPSCCQSSYTRAGQFSLLSLQLFFERSLFHRYLDNLQSNLYPYSACPATIKTCALNTEIALHCKMRMETGQYFNNIPSWWRKFIIITVFSCNGDRQQRQSQDNLIYLLFGKALTTTG